MDAPQGGAAPGLHDSRSMAALFVLVFGLLLGLTH